MSRRGLSALDIVAIRSLYANHNFTIIELASIYMQPESTIKFIIERFKESA